MRKSPSGWAIEKLGDLAQRITKGSTPTSYGFAFQNSGIRFIKIENIKNERVFHPSIKHFISTQAHETQKRSVLEDGDVLFSIAGTIGNSCLITKDDLPANTNQALAIIRGTSPAFHPQFLIYQLQSNTTKTSISKQARGGGMNNVSLTDVKNISVCIAPLNEQHRIVAKLEKLLAKVDKCKERLEKIPAILKRFRQSVLAAACSGELTRDWRRENLNVESSKSLLKQVLTERNIYYKNRCNEAKELGIKKPPPFRSNNIPIDTENYDVIPVKWHWERLVNIADIHGGVTKGRKLKASKTLYLPYLRVANVQDGYLNLTEMKEIEVLPEDLVKYRLEDGDILFTEGGDRDKLGRGTVWKNNIKNCIHQNHIFRARLYSSKLSSEYISLATKSHCSKEYFFNNASQTVNLASINMTTLGDLPLPIPPADEQREIVRRVEALFEVADRIKARYAKAKAHIDNLTQSILAKAFRGELVPQDPSDEPASEHLKRIKAERAQQEISKTRHPRPRNRKVKKENVVSGAQPETEGSPAPTAKAPSQVRKTGNPIQPSELDQPTVMAAFRRVFRNRTAMSRDDFLKEVSTQLGYQRLSAKLAVYLKGEIRAAMLRGIIRSGGDRIIASSKNIDDYDTESLIRFMSAVMGKGKLFDEETVIRETAKYLGFQRTSKGVRSTFQSAIRAALRQGLMQRENGRLRRI